MDIIFFAAVAVYIFLKLRGQFGKVDEDQKRDAIKRFLKEQADVTSHKAKNDANSKDLDGKKLEPAIVQDESIQEDSEILDGVDDKVQKSFISVLEKSNVSASNFINGSKAAFEMIINAFSSCDKETLESLLSKDLFKKFEAAIDERIRLNQVLNVSIISIDKAIVKSAKVVKDKAIICVNLISKQISYTVDEKEKIIDGCKDDINEISDIWTFSRDIKSKNPNWTITSTKS